MKFDNVAFNWFDLGVLGLLAVGVFRGRSRGMSQELLDVLTWLVIVVAGGLSYQPVGRFVAGYTHLGLTWSYVLAYFGVIVMARLFFGWIKRLAGEKLVGSDVFGESEYYLGMLAGAIRFACYILVGMAFLNAQVVTSEQLAAEARMQKENFGDISFPTIGRIQQTVFDGSASGQFVKRHLAHELIVSAESDKDAGSADTLRSRRERAISEILGDK